MSDYVSITNTFSNSGVALSSGAGLPVLEYAEPSTIGSDGLVTLVSHFNVVVASVGWVSEALPIAFVPRLG